MADRALALRSTRREVWTFLSLLYGETAAGYLALWTRQDKRTRWFPARALATAARLAVQLAECTDVYFGIGLHPRPRASHERGTSDGVIAIPGLWDDIDVAGPAHQKERLPPTREAALALIQAFPLSPTIIVDSGHGLQPWWLFREPWTFDAESERRDAQDLVRRFQATLHARAAAQGWTWDSTHDLARVLRLPGTWNRKLEPVPVRMIALDEGRRYSVDDLEPYLLDLPCERADWPSTADLRLPVDLPPVDVADVRIPYRIKALISGGWDAARGRYDSRSEAVFAVVQALISAGCDDAVIASVLLDPRNSISEKPRQRGRRWVGGELARARAKRRPILPVRPAPRRPVLRREVTA